MSRTSSFGSTGRSASMSEDWDDYPVFSLIFLVIFPKKWTGGQLVDQFRPGCIRIAWFFVWISYWIQKLQWKFLFWRFHCQICQTSCIFFKENYFILWTYWQQTIFQGSYYLNMWNLAKFIVAVLLGLLYVFHTYLVVSTVAFKVSWTSKYFVQKSFIFL